MEIAAVIFVLVLAAAAYVAFRLLKRVVKTAVRLFVVFLILLIAVAGGATLWFWSTGSDTKPPATRKPR